VTQDLKDRRASKDLQVLLVLKVKKVTQDHKVHVEKLDQTDQKVTRETQDRKDLPVLQDRRVRKDRRVTLDQEDLKDHEVRADRLDQQIFSFKVTTVRSYSTHLPIKVRPTR